MHLTNSALIGNAASDLPLNVASLEFLESMAMANFESYTLLMWELTHNQTKNNYPRLLSTKNCDLYDTK